MTRRVGLIVLEIVGVLVAGAAVLAGILFWRLSSGPIEVGFLTPYLEEALEDGPVQLSIGDTSIRWNATDRTIVLVATEVRLVDKDETAVATIPQVQATLSLRDLVTGALVPRRLELVRPDVRITRATDGTFSFGLGEELAAGDGDSDAVGFIVFTKKPALAMAALR